jgi:hypothetical protein
VGVISSSSSRVGDRGLVPSLNPQKRPRISRPKCASNPRPTLRTCLLTATSCDLAPTGLVSTVPANACLNVSDGTFEVTYTTACASTRLFLSTACWSLFSSAHSLDSSRCLLEGMFKSVATVHFALRVAHSAALVELAGKGRVSISNVVSLKTM